MKLSLIFLFISYFTTKNKISLCADFCLIDEPPVTRNVNIPSPDIFVIVKIHRCSPCFPDAGAFRMNGQIEHDEKKKGNIFVKYIGF